jgi:signal transduction histidine kinase
MADWCVIDGVNIEQKLHRLVSFHVNPAKTRLVSMFHIPDSFGLRPSNGSVNEPLLSSNSSFYHEINPSDLTAASMDSSQLEIARRLNPRSAMIVPIYGHGRILGRFLFVLSDSGRRYNTGDLILAEELARRVGLAMENARLYAEAQKLNVELEQRVTERTRQLEAANASLTRQVSERRQAEEKVQILNAELEQRVADRTRQLEILNRQLQNEIVEHQAASEKLRILLKRTRELYRLSKAIGSVREPNEVFPLLLSSSFLRGASRASIAVFDRPWKQKKSPPRAVTILAEWNKDTSQAKFVNQRFTLEEYGVVPPIPAAWPIVHEDIPTNSRLVETVRRRFIDLHTRHLIIFPLYAGGDWYGLLSLHFKSRRVATAEDLLHVRGLVSEAAVAINNTRLLEVEGRARREAEQADNLKLKFLAMISHELRTPLTSIKGFATTLLAEDVAWDVESQSDFLKTIDSEADKLGDLIDQLLDLSRIEAGTLRIAPQSQTLQAIIETAKNQLLALTHQHELMFDLPVDLPEVIADRQRVAQILTNLVGNAAKYSPLGTLISVSAHLTGKTVQIDVMDQGPGIPVQDRGRVFEAFRQLDVKTDHRARGAGLGLAICKGLVQAHGGQIWIQDTTAPGTTISFTLPVVQPASKLTGRRRSENNGQQSPGNAE